MATYAFTESEEQIVADALVCWRERHDLPSDHAIIDRMLAMLGFDRFGRRITPESA